MAKANKEQLYDAYRYLAGYNSIVTKDMVKVQENVDKALVIKPEDPDGLKLLLNPVPATPVPAVKTPVTPATKIPKK